MRNTKDSFRPLGCAYAPAEFLAKHGRSNCRGIASSLPRCFSLSFLRGPRLRTAFFWHFCEPPCDFARRAQNKAVRRDTESSVEGCLPKVEKGKIHARGNPEAI